MELSSSNIFSKESFSCISKVSEIFLIIQETKISSGNFLYFRKLKKWNKWTLKNFLVFLEMEVCTPNLKKKLLLIFGELLRAFHCCFFWCFHYPLLIFTTVFGVFSIFNTDFYHCFSFVSIIDCICSCHQLFLPWLISSCSFIASATDLEDLF